MIMTKEEAVEEPKELNADHKDKIIFVIQG